MRASILFVVIGLLAAGLLFDELERPGPGVAEATEQAIITPSVSDPARLDGAWFCPMGSSSANGFADHQLQISNLSDDPAVASVNILTGEGRGPTLRLEMSPLSTESLDLSSISQADQAGAVVEIVGGTGVVAHSVQTEHGPAFGACSTHVSGEWYFASGRTTRDSRQYLALMNPFPESATFDVEFYRTAGRPRRPDDLQAGVIDPYSVRIIEVESFVPREEAVAVVITTSRGRLVVERLQTLDGVLGPAGAALQLGVTAPAPSWMLPSGRIHGGGDDKVIVFNPSTEETASIEVELWPLEPTDRSLYGLGPIPRELLPGRFEIIDLRTEADRFGFRLPFEVGVSVTSANGVPIVVERWHFANQIDTSLIGAGGTEVAATEDEADPSDPVDETDEADPDAAVDPDDPDAAVDPDDPDATADPAADADPDAAADETAAVDPSAAEETAEEAVPGELDVPGILGGVADELTQPSPNTGVATSRGTEVLSTRWLVPWVSTPNESSSVVIVTSPEEAVVEMWTLVNGELLGPVQSNVAPGGRSIIPMTGLSAGAPVLITASAPVSVESQVVSVDGYLATVPGIPTIGQ